MPHTNPLIGSRRCTDLSSLRQLRSLTLPAGHKPPAPSQARVRLGRRHRALQSETGEGSLSRRVVPPPLVAQDAAGQGRRTSNHQSASCTHHHSAADVVSSLLYRKAGGRSCRVVLFLLSSRIDPRQPPSESECCTAINAVRLLILFTFQSHLQSSNCNPRASDISLLSHARLESTAASVTLSTTAQGRKWSVRMFCTAVVSIHGKRRRFTPSTLPAALLPYARSSCPSRATSATRTSSPCASRSPRAAPRPSTTAVPGSSSLLRADDSSTSATVSKSSASTFIEQ
jgi:hypothetical protein